MAKRGIALIEAYNGSLTKNEEQLQYLLKIMQYHRQKYPNCNKGKLKNSNGPSIFIAGFLTLTQSHPVDETLGNFIVDVSTSLFSTWRISALLCTNDEGSVNFSRQMSRNYVMSEVINSFENLDPTRLESEVDHRFIIVLDLDCSGALDILIKASETRMFVAPAKWLLIQDLRNPTIERNISKDSALTIIGSDNFSWVIENFRDLDMLPDSEVVLSRRMDDDSVAIVSLYRPSAVADLILEDRGYWTKETGLFIRDDVPASRRRQNLRQTHLKACLVITDEDTWNHLDDFKNLLVDAPTKSNYPWVFLLARRMNATVSFTGRDTWGYLQKNGSWSGMIGMLKNREVDIGGSTTFLTADRIGVISYIQLYTPTGSKFLFRRPPLSYVSNLFTLPFERSVWIAIGVLLILVIGLLYVAMKWEYSLKINNEIPLQDWTGNSDVAPTISDDLLVVMGAVSQQGSYYEPRIVPTRIIVLMALISTLSLYASYTANIVALLQSSADTINSPQDLMNSPMGIGIYDVVYNRYYFQAAQDPERKKFYETKVKGKEEVWLGLREGMSRVRKGLYAFHVEYGAGYQVIQETWEEGEKCSVHEIDYLKVLNPLLVVQHRSPYLEMFRVGALWIRETGLQYREISRIYIDKPVCQGQNNFISVGIIDCYAAYMTLACGTGITFFILLLEIIWSRWFSSKSEEAESTIDIVE
ncbi:glutamate receptor ionotropic, kainate 5-like [Venturia canescens]|uniref:glutamate receptor ionotropic, kainate 5-like n=1 Tax=Venturia canescens TaxID=32260 RepID=UPI001C9BD390|nr:glutamate receptor ionotropic, kainate 5-like [Venturia canescens]